MVEENTKISENFGNFKKNDQLTSNMKELIKIISKFKGSKYAFLINDILNVFDIDNFFKYSKL